MERTLYTCIWAGPQLVQTDEYFLIGEASIYGER